MRGSIVYQVHTLFTQSGLCEFGTSKHHAKEHARANGASNWSEMGRAIGIFAYGTANKYKDVARQAAKFIRERYGVRDLELLEPRHVAAYLEHCIDSGLARATFQQHAAAMAKLEQALNRYAALKGKARTYDFRGAIEGTRERARRELEVFDGSRAYERPEKLVAAIEDPTHQLAAALQFQGGPRIHEVALVRPEQCLGIEKDVCTGVDRGIVEVKGKGGKVYRVGVTVPAYEALLRIVQQNKEFRIDKDAYRRSLQEAARKTGQPYNGSHGLRWNAAQRRFTQLGAAGLTFEESLIHVSRGIGHNRADITLHYLR